MSIIIKPILTDKTTNLSEKYSRYGFRVSLTANKIQIKEAIESLYGVTVIAVNTARVEGKAKSRYTKTGILSGRTVSYKKAYVTLKEGDQINLY
jgi:large subunit ribosomal protein L23